MRKKMPVSFEDERGLILDIFKSNPKDHCTLITFTPGSTRANHFHKVSTQYTFVISGELTMATASVDVDGNLTSSVSIEILSSGDLVTHEPFKAHAFKSIGESVILAFADGLRGGDDYELDVFRLKQKIL